MATMMAMNKERFWYYSLFVGLVWIAGPVVAIKTHNPAPLGIMVTTGFGWTFQYDMFYGNMIVRA
mgnify:CR=1 FL=1